MNRISQFQRDCEPQAPSPLFSLLPGEIREAIYIEALKSYDVRIAQRPCAVWTATNYFLY